MCILRGYLRENSPAIREGTSMLGVGVYMGTTCIEVYWLMARNWSISCDVHSVNFQLETSKNSWFGLANWIVVSLTGWMSNNWMVRIERKKLISSMGVPILIKKKMFVACVKWKKKENLDFKCEVKAWIQNRTFSNLNQELYFETRKLAGH